MAGAAKRDNSDAVFFGFRNCQSHSHSSNNLADVVIAIDHGRCFAVAQDLGVFTDVYGAILNKR